MKILKTAIILSILIGLSFVPIISFVIKDTYMDLDCKKDTKPTVRSGTRNIITVDDDGMADFEDIQDAVDEAEDGDIIIVKSGIYEEEIEIYDKAIELQGEDPETTIIKGPDEFNNVGIFIESHNCTISGFSIFNWSDAIEIVDSSDITVKGCNCSMERGTNIYVTRSSGITIEANNCSKIPSRFEGDNGIILENCVDCLIVNNTAMFHHEDGIYLLETNNTRIINNYCVDNSWGISICWSGSNIVSENRCRDNYRGGIGLWQCTSQKIKDNILHNDGIEVSGTDLEKWCSHTIEKTNLVDGKPVIYKVKVDGGTITGPAGQLIMADCHNLNIANLAFGKGKYGILTGYSTNNTIENCTFYTNRTGIIIQYSNDTIIKNCLFSNIGEGIEMDNSDRNIIEKNQFLSCKRGIYPYRSDSLIIRSNVFKDYKYDGILFIYGRNNHIIDNNFQSGSGAYSSSIEIHSSSQNHISNNIISNNHGCGIDIQFTNDVVIESNTIFNNSKDGINIQYMCKGNTVKLNVISNNSLFGLNITCSSSNNLIHHNNFFYNNDGNAQVYDSSKNIWNDTYGNGNYWSDYSSKYPDAGNDGNVWDAPYVLNATREIMDEYPLVNPVNTEAPPVNGGDPPIIDDVPPDADAGEDVFLYDLGNITLDASDSTDDSGIESYTWNFEYNGSQVTLIGPEPTFNFSIPGNYTVNLTVKDKGGNIATDSIVITVPRELGPGGNGNENPPGPTRENEIHNNTVGDAFQIPWLWIGIGTAVFIFVLIVVLVIRKRRYDDDEYDDDDDDDEEADVYGRENGKDQRHGGPVQQQQPISMVGQPPKKCINCFVFLTPPNAVFCSHCGANQPQNNKPTPPVGMNSCLDCGTPIQPPLVFCDLCVMKQTQSANTTPAVQTYPPSAGTPALTGRYIQQQQAFNVPVTQPGYVPVATQPVFQQVPKKGGLPPPPVHPRYGPLQ